MEPNFTTEDLINLVPPLATTDAERLAMYLVFIKNAQLIVKPGFWGELYPNGVAYLAAHNILSYYADEESGGQERGAILSEKVGDLSRTYATPSSTTTSTDDLASTLWGRLYLQLRATLGGGIGMMVT